ncbi:hypothetical protein DHEL01_v209422 [Diaporthe helianthi]|uniref:Uncharacterized protein n=1 Tax=Diaporthe helianthi TaxID=158607 RepID=A0A2P5HPP3_DIAHE|nr:hypothetical protein DHEL01_v209422 [Diaporthe helianthi]
MALGPIFWDGIQFGSMTTSFTKILSWESGQARAARRMAAHARARRRRQPSRLWGLAAMVSTATAVSLNDLQPIANGVLPTICNMAYNAPFTGCTQADFASGERCSITCRDGIRTIEDVVDMVCEDVSSTRDSVLDFAQRGVLLLHTCDGDGDDITLAQTTSTTARTTTSIPPPPTIIAPPPTTSIAAPPTVAPSTPIIFTPPVLSSTSRTIGSFTIIPTPEPPPTSSTLVVPPIQSTHTATSVPTTVIPPLPTTSATTSQLSPPPPSDTQTSFQTSTQSSSTRTTSATAEPSPQDDGDGQDQGRGRGGGSPFDVQVSLSTRLCCANLALYLTVGATLLGVIGR